MAEPWSRGICERLRKSLGWFSWQEQQEGAVGGTADKLHCTGTSNKHAESGAAFLPSLLSALPVFSLLFLPFLLYLSFPFSILPLFFLLPSSLLPFHLSVLSLFSPPSSLCPSFSSLLLRCSWGPSIPPSCFLSPSLYPSLFLHPLPSLCSPQLLPFVPPNGLPQASVHIHHYLKWLEGGCPGPIVNRPV